MTKTAELRIIAASATVASGAVPQNGEFPTMAAVVNPASSDAAAYFHTAAIRDDTPKPIGRPAYQKAGSKSAQKERLQDVATPAGPHGNARINNKAVAADSNSVQRSQRSGFPMER